MAVLNIQIRDNMNHTKESVDCLIGKKIPNNKKNRERFALDTDTEVYYITKRNTYGIVYCMKSRNMFGGISYDVFRSANKSLNGELISPGIHKEFTWRT